MHASYQTLDFEYSFAQGTVRLDLTTRLTPATTPTPTTPPLLIVSVTPSSGDLRVTPDNVDPVLEVLIRMSGIIQTGQKWLIACLADRNVNHVIGYTCAQGRFNSDGRVEEIVLKPTVWQWFGPLVNVTSKVVVFVREGKLDVSGAAGAHIDEATIQMLVRAETPINIHWVPR